MLVAQVHFIAQAQPLTRPPAQGCAFHVEECVVNAFQRASKWLRSLASWRLKLDFMLMDTTGYGILSECRVGRLHAPATSKSPSHFCLARVHNSASLVAATREGCGARLDVSPQRLSAVVATNTRLWSFGCIGASLKSGAGCARVASTSLAATRTANTAHHDIDYNKRTRQSDRPGPQRNIGSGARDFRRSDLCSAAGHSQHAASRLVVDRNRALNTPCRSSSSIRITLDEAVLSAASVRLYGDSAAVSRDAGYPTSRPGLRCHQHHLYV